MALNQEYIQKYDDLLNQFKKITPSDTYRPTFMDISGYPHYEDVISNILSFFFRNKEIHGLNNLFLHALCRSYDESFGESIKGNVEVKREVHTLGGNYIDILIESDDIVIGIENKIYHSVYNDLKDYSTHIDRISGKRRNMKILLSLNVLNDRSISDSGFNNITYSEYFGKIEELIGSYLLEADQKYLSYYIDLVQTINRLREGTVMNKELLRYLTENEDEVNRFLKELSKVRKELRSKIEELAGLIDTKQYKNITKSYYRELYGELYDTLIYEKKKDKGFTTTIEAIISPSGWYFDVYSNKSDILKFEALMNKENIHLKDSYTQGRKRLPEEFDYEVSLGEVAGVVRRFLEIMSKR